MLLGSHPDFELGAREFVPPGEQFEQLRDQRRVAMGLSRDVPRDQAEREFIESEIRERAPEDEVEITITFPDADLPSLSGFARRELLDRGERVRVRDAGARQRASEIVSILRARGSSARSISPLWLTNSVQLRVTAADAQALIAANPEAIVSMNAQAAAEWDGNTARSAAGAGGARLIAAGLNGDPVGTGRYRIAVIEAQVDWVNWPFAQNAPVFRESSVDFTSRISVVEDCDTCIERDYSQLGAPCIEWSCAATSNRTNTNQYAHGNTVAWIAAGSLEEGQDLWIGTPAARVARSGVAPEAQIDYYGVRDCAGTARALQRAVQRGVDVANISLGFSGGMPEPCWALANCGGLNEAIRAATQAGVVVVKSAGNSRDPYDGGADDELCHLTYPAWRPEVISVGNMTSGSATATYSSIIEGQSSFGGVRIHYAGHSSDQSMAGLGLMATGQVHCWPQTADGGSSGYSCSGSAGGTSFAAPFVSGAAVLFAHAMSTTGTITDARTILVNLLLMGDAFGGSPSSVPIGISEQTGYGRIRLFAPRSDVLTAPWGWGTRSGFAVGTTRFSVGSTGPEAGVREWRWATMSFEHDLYNLQTDYVISVWDTCVPGTPAGSRHLVTGDYSYDMRKRIQLSEAQICPPGNATCRCLEMQVDVYSAPGTGPNIMSADFFHGDSPTNF